MLNEIRKDFKMFDPKLKIIQVVDFDNDHYLVAACEDMNHMPMDPYFKYNKNDGTIEPYDNSKDFESFFKLCKNNTIYVVKQ